MRLKAKSIFILILLIIILFTLAACNGFTPNPTGEEKATPVYQGMEVSKTLSNLSANNSISANITRLSNIGVTRNLNTNPIDQDDPFGTLDDGTISEVVTTEFPVTQTEVADYYSEINKDIFITVKLSNPDNFVILSFTLNGVFYQSYQFQDGSDSENLILKVNTGTVSGVKEYTIDAIKYIDGTEIKDVIFAGERTITVGLKHNSEPSVLVSDEVVNATSILLTVNLSDSQSLSTLNKIVLYDGESLVQIYDLSLGENNIVFDKLNINTLYQYAVISVYDLIDGNNSRLSLLEKKALYTDDIVSIDNVVPTQESISFGITVTDADEVGSITAIELYKGETLIEALTDLSLREFTGLLSNNEYTVKVTYTYDLDDGVGEQTEAVTSAISTQAKTVPTVEINSVVPTQDSIAFNIDVTDPDSVGSITAIELYKGETLIEALTDLNVREFTGLLSNNEYQIKVTYTYDLDDGVGEQTEAVTSAISTQAKTVPTVEINSVVPTQDSIVFNIDVTDPDSVGSITAIELYQGETLVEALTDLSLREFTGLLSNNEYTVKVAYTYDLNDGVSAQTLTINQVATTLAKATPTVSIDNVVPTQTSIGFGITVTDVDQVGAVSAIELYKGETLIEALTDLNVREFTGLLSNNEYQIKVTYTYDLDDGIGLLTGVSINNFKTPLFEGMGTEGNPYLIRTSADLDNIRFLPDAYYFLENDIDLSGYEWSIIPTFSGVFDGQNYSISQFSPNRLEISPNNYVFGFIQYNQGTIKNLQFEDYNLNLIVNGSAYIAPLVLANGGLIENVLSKGTIQVTVDDYVRIGGIASENTNSGIIRFSYSEVSIKATSKYYGVFAGGLVGLNFGLVELSSTNSNIITTSNGEHCSSDAGLLVGNNESGTIQYSTSSGSISSFGGVWSDFISVGGLVGNNGGLISNSYSNASVLGDVDYNYTYVGGLVGYNNRGDILNSFAIGSVSREGGAGDFVGGLVGKNYGDIENSYTYSVQIIVDQGTTIGNIHNDYIGIQEVENAILFDFSFFQNTLAYKIDYLSYYDFTNLDSNYLPTIIIDLTP